MKKISIIIYLLIICNCIYANNLSDSTELKIKYDTTIILNNIFFEFESCELRSESYPSLDSLIHYLESISITSINIIRYEKRPSEFSSHPTECRAENIKLYLENKNFSLKEITSEGIIDCGEIQIRNELKNLISKNKKELTLIQIKY